MTTLENKILELIKTCEDCEKKLPYDEQFIHVVDIKSTLLKAIDDSRNKENEAKDWPHGI